MPPSDTYAWEWVRFFIFTVLVEAAVAFPMLRDAEPSPFRRIGAILIANFTTHPLVFFFIARVIHDRTTMTIVAESWAILAETCVYALVFGKLTWPKALGVSALSNAASFALGTLATRAHILT